MSASLHLVCPHCHAVNRVPAARLGESPNCGKCRRPLFAGEPVALGGDAFETHLARSDLPLLVDFWAEWCGPCKMMAPQFARAAGLLEPQLRLAKVDTEAEQGLAARYGIRSIPTLVLFKGGRELARKSGALGAEEIARWARSVL